MELLLQKGLDLNKLPIRNTAVGTLLQEIYQMKRIPSYPQTQLSRDVEDVRLQMLKLLLKYKINVNVVDKVYILHVNRLLCVIMLLTNGYNVGREYSYDFSGKK